MTDTDSKTSETSAKEVEPVESQAPTSSSETVENESAAAGVTVAATVTVAAAEPVVEPILFKFVYNIT